MGTIRWRLFNLGMIISIELFFDKKKGFSYKNRIVVKTVITTLLKHIGVKI